MFWAKVDVYANVKMLFKKGNVSYCKIDLKLGAMSGQAHFPQLINKQKQEKQSLVLTGWMKKNWTNCQSAFSTPGLER